MSSQPEVPSEADAEERDDLFLVLDAYVDALHEWDTTESGRLLARHPEHADLLETLNTLDRLAPPRTAIFDSEAGPEPDDPDTFPGSPADERGRFGKFELFEELGRGGMGVVYRARQTDLGRVVAIKMILSNRLATSDDVRRFETEARTAAGVRHANIVGIHEVGEFHGQPFFTMEYVGGPSLERLVADGPLPPEEAARVVARLARAVEHLHEHGIVHRDLKPSNVLLDENREPRLTDFGLAKVFQSDDTNTRTGTIVGTASYMAPEQAAGRVHDISPRTDVYGLGAILYELLTGQPPFREKHALDTLVQVLEGEPTLPRRINAGVPRDLERICRKCLEKNPDERYASAAEVAEDLERWLRNEPIHVEGTTPYHFVRRWVRRQPALVARLACVVLAALIIQVRFLVIGGDLAYHSMVMSTLAAWAVAHAFFQWLLECRGTATLARYCWVTSDILFQTVVLFLVEGKVGPLVVGYPLIIAASGLFFRLPLVLYTTLLSAVCYGFFAWNRDDFGSYSHFAIIFMVILGVQGLIVAYQVHRVRILSRYYGAGVPD